MGDALRAALAALTPAQRELFLALAPPAARTDAPTSVPANAPADGAPVRYALGPAQERFWLLEQLHPGEPAHHVPGALAIEGDVEPAAWRRAIEALVRRHDALRTTFASDAAGPHAVVQPADAVTTPLAIEDLGALVPADRDRRLAELRTTNALAPFDLGRAPLLRCTLVRLAARRWELLWCVHHVAVDGLSMVVLARDLAAALRDGESGESGSASPAPAPAYRDFVAWQAQREAAGAWADDLAWHAARLAGAPATQLRPDFVRRAAQPMGARCRRAVAPELAAALTAHARAHGCTPFVALLAAFAAALARWLDTDDLVLGIPTANRPRADLHDAVGLFVDSAVLRLRAEPDATFTTFLQHVRGAVQATLAHGNVPFERLVQHLRPERRLDRNPLFQVMFNHVDFATLPAAPPGCTWQNVETPAGTLFDFTLYVRHDGDALVLEAEYDAGRFALATIERRLDELATLLHGVVTRPDATLAELPLLTDPELHTIAALEAGPALPAGAEHVLELVRAAPAAARVVDDDGELVHDALLTTAARVASALRAAGVEPGDRVAFLLARTRRLPAALLGIWHAGGVAVPLDASLPDARRRAVLAAAAPRALLVDALPGDAAAVAAVGVRHVVLPGEHDARAPRPTVPPVLAPPEAPAYVLFTSGSTGAPKGVVVGHGALAAFLRAARATFAVAPGDRWLAITSPTFDIALLELLLPLCAGGTVHVAPAAAVRDGELLARLLQRHRPAWLQATPSTFRLLLETAWRGAPDELHLLCGGEPLDAALATALRTRAAVLWNVYGPTETTIWSTAWRATEGTDDVRIGRPLPGTVCRVLDARGARVPVGCPGEAWLGGAGTALGYLDDPAGTAARFVTRDGTRWYRTGDTVRWLGDGALEFVGRRDSQVKVHGHRLELGEVEALARAVPGVADAAATVIEGANGPAVALLVVPRTGASGAAAAAAAPAGGASHAAVAQTAAWRDVWDGVFAEPAVDTELDARGWIDSRTGRPFPAAVLRAFRDRSAERVRALQPRAVLEVGCGAGLLTAVLAGECERWLAIDPAPAAVAAVQVLALRRGWRHVVARELGAAHLDTLPPAAFDCVLLHSVAQYLPDLDTLLAVLAAARARLRPGGCIVLGDVRLLPLHPVAAAWIEAARAAPSTTAAELATNAARRVAAEPELLLAPTLFDALVAAGCFADRWVALRAGGADTEMDRFRADVVLTLDSTFAPASALPEVLPNARVPGAPSSAVEPDALGAAVVPTADGRGLVAVAPPLAPRTPAPPASAPLPAAAALRAHANVPRGPRDDDALCRALRAALASHLPPAIVPAVIGVVDDLPRLPSGKLDRARLPAMLPVAAPATAVSTATATATERRVAELFAAVLGVPRVGANDDFFALGGHSLAAARLLARVRAELRVELPLRTVFAGPTVRALAAAIDRAPGLEGLPLAARPRPPELRPSGTMARLWFLQRLLPRSRAYLMIGVLDADGPLDVAALTAAVDDVVARHEVLRLRFVEHGGAATLAPRDAPVPWHRTTDLAAFVATLRALDGDTLAPLQVVLAPRADGGHRLAFVLHHAFADAWSLAVLERDLAAAYTARARGAAPAWPPLPLQYVDHAAWQRERLAAAERDRLATFWRDALRDAPAELELPTLAPRPAVLGEAGAAIAVTLPEPVLAGARACAAAHGASLFHVVLAAFEVWLARLARQDDVVVGTTHANRDDPRLEDVVGCFVQSLPLRARLHDDPSFAQHVVRTRDTVLAAIEHRHLPFQELVEAVAPPRSLARTPLFQVTLDWLDVPIAPPAEAGGVRWSRVAHDPGAAKLDLALVVHGHAPFAATLEYRTELFAASTIDAWWRAFTTLLASAVAAPATRVHALPWLDATERARLLAAGTGPVVDRPAADVVDAIVAAAARRPETIAVSTPDANVTYRELVARVAALAAALRRDGVAPGERVAIHGEPGVGSVVAMLAVLDAGAAWVPLDVDLPAARLQAMVDAAQVRRGIAGDPVASAGVLPRVDWRAAAGDADAPATADADADIAVGTGGGHRETRRGPRPGGLAYVLFTSGTSGAPKGVAVSHRALHNYVAWARDTYGGRGGAPLHTPLGFDLSLTSVLPVLTSGGTVHVPARGAGIEPLLRSLAHGPFDFVKLTPSHLRAWLAARPAAAVAAAARGLVLGGEALDHELLAPLRAAGGQRHWNEYGPTEATVGCAVYEVPAAAPAHGPVPIGRAITNLRLYVLDALREPVPHGVVGELWLAGAGLADGYLGDPERTAAVFVADPFVPGARMYRSGDLAAFGPDLELVYRGRAGDGQVKVRGHRVELAEVRAVLRAQPGVHDAAVVVRSAPSGGDHVVGWFVGDAHEAALRTALAATLAPAAVPTRLVAVAALPFDRHGKLDVDALPDPFGRDAIAAPPAPPSSVDDDPRLRRVVALARELLRVPDLGADDDFFRAGGDSILALQLVARAEALGVPLAVADVFRRPRLRDLVAGAAAVGAAAATGTGAAEPATAPLLPMQRWLLAQQLAVPAHYDQAIWLALRPGTSADAVAAALDTLVARHPALHTRCGHDAGGGRQERAAPRRGVLERVDVAALPAAERQPALAAIVARAGTFRPEHGDVLAATFVAPAAGSTPRLYLRAHHVAIDAVGWRVLAEDLDALLAGRELLPPTASPLAFATWLDAATARGDFAGDAAALRALPFPAFPAWAPGTEADARRAALGLDVDATRGVLAGADSRHRVRADELVVAALARALHRLLGVGAVRVDVEGHGRAVPGAPPLHRSVGWFTTVCPLVLDELAAEPAERIARTKERVRALPRGGVAALGLALPASPVLMNFLGDLDGIAGDVVTAGDGDPGPLRAPANRRSHSIELQAAVRARRLHFDVVVSPDAPAAFAAELVGAIRDELAALATAWATTAARPSLADWPLADVDREQLAGLLADDGPGEVDALYPLTPTQQGMFFHAQRDPDSLAYREQLGCVLAGALDRPALLAAFDDVARRHELLRGEVHWRGLRVPHWLVRRSHHARLRHTDLAREPDDGRALRALAAAELAAPFRFEHDPLLRVTIATLARGRHALLVTWHHVVLDGWSMPLLLGELVHRYRTNVGDALPALAPAARFADHIALLRDQDAAAQRVFWRDRLAGVVSPTRVPGDRSPAPAGARGPWHECEARLDRAATARLQAFGRTHGVTASTLVAAAWALALWRCTGSRDVLFGITVAGRDQALGDVERRIGLFINTLPLRVALDPGSDVVGWLRAVQATIAAGLVHQHTPLPLSQAQTDVPPGVDPLASLLVFENYPLAAALRELPPGLALESTFAFERTSYPLTIVALPGDTFCLRLLADAQHYGDALAGELLDGTARALRSLLDAPPRLDAVVWLPPAPLVGPAPRAGAPGVLAQVAAAAARTPDAIAVDPIASDGDRATGERTSYRELLARARTIAAALAPHVRGAEPLVALCAEPGAGAYAAMLGAWWAGAAFVPLDPSWPPARLAAVVAAARPRALLVTRATRHVVAAAERTIEAALVLDDLLPGPEAGNDAPPPDVAPDALAYAICTSGTTGAPKLVLVPHGALASYVAAAREHFELRAQDRVLQLASLAFDTAQEETWPALAAGATVVPCPAEARATSARFVAFGRAAALTVWDLPTAYFHVLAATLDEPSDGIELPASLRLCVLGGQACRPAAARTFLAAARGRVRLVNTYGPSEATIVATWCDLASADVAASDDALPIGRPVPGVVAHVLGADLGALPARMPGELCLGGAGLARGYLGDDAATAARFVVHPTTGERLYRTGDRVRERADGQLVFLGRVDRQVKLAGVRIELDEVEHVLQRHPNVTDAVVVAALDAGGEPVLTAHVEATPMVGAATLRTFVATWLPAASVPAHVVPHERLPRTSSGKVDVGALAAAGAHDALAGSPAVAAPAATDAQPSSAREADVRAVFAELFAGRTIGPDDDFFALGGSSLLAVRLLDALERRCGVDLPLQAVFAQPTPAAIARTIDGALGGDGAGPDAAPPPPELYDDLRGHALPRVAPRPFRAPEHVLLTGATGFFGRHLLAALLAHPTTRTVHCLVRADDERTARARLGDAARDPRVHVVRGDVAEPGLGLSPAARDTLGGTLTTVVHAAAAVDFVRPYTQLRAANVVGTHHALALAAQLGLTFHHVSSVGVFTDPRVRPGDRIGVAVDAAALDRPVGGYAQSKWVAERLVERAGSAGLDVVVHRLGRLVGDVGGLGELGLGGAPELGNDFAGALAAVCRATQLVPDLAGTFDVTPAGRAAAALVTLAQRPHPGRTFHLVNPDPPDGPRVVAAARALGITLRRVPWAEFRAAALRWLATRAEPIAAVLHAALRHTTPPPPPEPRFADDCGEPSLATLRWSL